MTPQFTNVYFNMSNGDGRQDMRGPWNNEPLFEYRDAEPAVDGGSGMPDVALQADEEQVVQELAARTRSDPNSDPMSGSELGMASAADPTDASVQRPAASDKARGGVSQADVPAPEHGFA